MEAVANLTHGLLNSDGMKADTEEIEFELRIMYHTHHADRKSLEQKVESSVFMLVFASSRLLFRLISSCPFRFESSISGKPFQRTHLLGSSQSQSQQTCFRTV